MIKKFNVNVNGNSYYVEVEEIKDGSVPRPVAPPVAPAPKPAAAATVAPAPAPVAPEPVAKTAALAGDVTLEAPMPGTILVVAVKVGDAVKEGQLAVVLEAMKMENELQIPADGTVKAVNVSKGSSVNTSDVLVIIG